jgi:IS5 family transposase
MIEMRRAQLSFGDGLITAEVDDLREPWMVHADAVLADEQLVATVYEALAKRHPKSRSRGRRGTPAEVVLRLLILKHIRNWSYQALEREGRANLVYRDFTRVGAAKMPDAKTMSRWGTALGPQVIAQIHERIVAIAKDKGVVKGRKMRVDTTVVETNIHYPTDSSLLGDGVRVLTRIMKKITTIAVAWVPNCATAAAARSYGCWILRGRRAPRPSRAGRSSPALTASCSVRRAAWWGRPSVSHKTSLPASSAPAASPSNWRWRACGPRSSGWCRSSAR